MTLAEATANREQLENMRFGSRDAYRAYIVAELEEGRLHNRIAADRFTRDAIASEDFSARCTAELGKSKDSDRCLTNLIRISDADAVKYRAAAIRYAAEAEA